MGNCLPCLERRNRTGYMTAMDDDSDDDVVGQPLMSDEQTVKVRTQRDGGEGGEVPARKPYRDDSEDDEDPDEDQDPKDGYSDPLSDAALRANVASLLPDLETPVPSNTPADANLLDL